MRNWWGAGSTWHHCSHAGASFRPSSLNCGSRGFDPYGTAQLSVGVIKHYQHFSEWPRAKNKLEMKHVMKCRGFCSTRYPCCWWAFLPCSFSWLGTRSVHTLHCSYCVSMQSCLEFINWDSRLLCAVNYGLFYYRYKVVWKQWFNYRKQRLLMLSAIISQHLSIKLAHLWIAFC